MPARRQRVEHPDGAGSNLGDRLLESRGVGLGGPGETADLADVLTGGGLDLGVGGRRFQTAQFGDVAAHETKVASDAGRSGVPGYRDDHE